MPPKSPQPSYTKKPVRRLRLPKIGPSNAKGFFEEYFHAGLVALFVIVTVLGKAGGMSGYDAVVVGAWVTGFAWFARRLKDYFEEKSKTEAAKASDAAAQPVNGAPKGPQPLPAGMKPMIGPQWPLRSGPWPTRPGLKSAPSVPPSAAQAPGAPTLPPTTPGGSAPVAPPGLKKPAFLYERPTLPDRKTKLPHNWLGRKDKKPKR